MHLELVSELHRADLLREAHAERLAQQAQSGATSRRERSTAERPWLAFLLAPLAPRRYLPPAGM
jgi:hypothetical protein